MIYGNIQNLKEYPFLDSQIKECFEYAASHDLVEFETKFHYIDGERLYVNIAEFTTTTPEERPWEAHKKYLDIHMVLRGAEQIDLAFVENMTEKEYVEENDFVSLDGEKNSSVTLRQGDFLICYPSDAHRTAIAVGASENIKKAIFKVRI